MAKDRERNPSDRAGETPMPREAPRAPTEAEWAAMSAAERERAARRLETSVSEEENAEREAMAEGDQHLDAKVDARNTLRRYYGKLGLSIYVGADITVYYPGEKGFVPDLIAVRDVDPRPRTSWMVSREGKGVELALEVHHQGDWSKDFVRNVSRYAQLGIIEYFILDVKRKDLIGYRLPRGARAYQPLHPERGRYASEVLGLDLTLEGSRLRFYHGTAPLLDLEQMLDKESARAEEEKARAEEEHARAEEEKARAEDERARADEAIERLREAILLALRARDVPITDDQRATLRATSDVLLLDRWLRRAFTAATAAEMFRDA